MNSLYKSKILSLDELIRKVEDLKHAGKVIVQSHGIYDLIHPGIIKHLSDAKAQGDILIITVIKDKDIIKGPGRPVFNENLRLETIASLQEVDYVCPVDNDPPFECIRKIKPDIFAKGQSYSERDRIIHKKIFETEKDCYIGDCKIFETGGISFSSSKIINSFGYIYTEETAEFLNEFSSKYSFTDIAEKLNDLNGLKILILGDGIIDEYHYCETMGKSPKSQLIVNKYLNHEVFAGGAFSIANHVAELCNEIHLVTLLGKDDSKEDLIRSKLNPNIDIKFFYSDDCPTIVKKRYINRYQKQRLFEINFINDDYIDEKLESEIIDYLEIIPEFDLVLVSDFGHGLITDKIIRVIEKLSKKLAVNTQTNGANAGHNLITKYRKTGFICLDTPEARLATQEKHADIEIVGKKLLKSINVDYLIITLGSEGSLCFSKMGEINHTPAFSTKVIDIIGAGDAFFSYTAPCFAQGYDADFVSFIGNVVGALAVQIVGNKKPVEKYQLLEFANTLLKGNYI